MSSVSITADTLEGGASGGRLQSCSQAHTTCIHSSQSGSMKMPLIVLSSQRINCPLVSTTVNPPHVFGSSHCKLFK